MEVGAVKQAFNNEVIHLKKNLSQAKIQTIHKLTRKAKNFTQRTAPEALKDKLKRKAESAVKEVLIIKKIKPRDIARFTVTHTGKLTDYLNKPEVDQNKACARLLIHKALQVKYKLIRERFGDTSINDLLMSRQERLKLKKDLRDKQNEKRKSKVKNEAKMEIGVEDKNSANITEQSLDVEMINGHTNITSECNTSDDSEESENENDSVQSNDIFESNSKLLSSDENDVDDHLIVNDVGKSIQPLSDDEKTNESCPKDDCLKTSLKVPDRKPKLDNKIKKSDKRKENKNKNINEKILNRNFKKKTNDMPEVVKVVDPFFVTSTGDNYLSLAEPRAPDEVKEVHRQGNRQYRRAVMFGHVPKIKPKKNYEKFNQGNKKTNNKDNSQLRQNNINVSESDNRKGKLNDNKIENKPEKLHPSWEAKKKHSSILPYQGKKIVFSDN